MQDAGRETLMSIKRGNRSLLHIFSSTASFPRTVDLVRTGNCDQVYVLLVVILVLTCKTQEEIRKNKATQIDTSG